MTFSIDRTRSFLKVEESNLLSLHRSILPIVPTANYCQGHLCDAFICVVNEYNLHRVYMALYDQRLKSNLVFISDPVRPDEKKIAALLQEAHGFLENIGFEIKQVDINFSSAIRGVIIKDIRVMREPSLPLQLEAAKAALEILTAGNREITLKAAREQMELQAELEDLKKRLIAAPAVQQAATIEPPANAEERAGAGADAAHKDNGMPGEEWGEVRLASAEKEVQKLREELGTVESALKSAKDAAKQAKNEQKFHEHENGVLNEKLQSEQMELDKARKEIEVLRRELHEAGKTGEAAHQAETAGLKAEINRLKTELAGRDSTNTGEAELLRAAFAEANVSLSAEKAKNESALREMDALERNAANQLKLLKKKVDDLTAEKQLLEKSAAEIETRARGEIERQQQINQSQRKTAINKLNALKEEIRQLSEARAVIASPTGMPLIQSGKNIPSLPPDDRTERPIFSQHAGFASEPFGSHDAAENINFLPNKLLKGIPYSFATDVVEVYRSYNIIHAAPTGKKSQRCDGIVCLVTEGGRSQVYLAWLMNTTGEVLICLPDPAAEGDDLCLRTVRAGIAYFERVGFLIDRLHLEENPYKRQIQLDGLAVFRRNSKGFSPISSIPKSAAS